MIRKRICIAAACIAVSASAVGATGKNCNEVHCAAGDKATTYGPKGEPFMVCPTRELSDYMTFEYGMLAMSAVLTGKMPNVSDKTGDIEYLDGPNGPNETRLMQDHFRNNAKVRTFDEAVAMCAKGKDGRPVTILNWPDDKEMGMSAWVRDERAKVSYWMPKGSLNKR